MTILSNWVSNIFKLTKTEDGSFIAHGTHAGNTHRHMMIEDNTQDFYTNTLQPCKAMILDADESVVTMDCGYKYVMYYTSTSYA